MKLALLGDIALFGKMTISNNQNWKEYFSVIEKVLSGMDYVVGNLETPFSIKKQTNGAKSAYICSDVDNVRILKHLHVNAVSLANNHIFDYGREGYETTKKNLDENGISWFGAEGKELQIEIGENRLSFLGFCCYSSNPLHCVPYGEYGVNEYNVEVAEELVARLTDEGYLPVAMVHTGEEHVNYPSLETVWCARNIATHSPMVYCGHHPHVVQGIESVQGSLIAYSLGNFCFDDVYSSVSNKPLIKLSENNRSSIVLVIEIDNNKILSWDVIPIYIGRDRLRVGEGVDREDIDKYTNAIHNMSPKDYVSMRNQLISDYINQRKSQRTILWYLKRLRPRYMRILLNARSNKKKYSNSVLKLVR